MKPDDVTGHQAAQEALPWLANGSLGAGEEQSLRAHLRGCAQCRDDLALLQAMRAAGPGPAPGCDTDRAWSQMLARLDALPADASSSPVPAPKTSVLARWRARIAANDGGWLRFAVAVQACAIAVLALMLMRPDDGAAYRGLGAAPAARADIMVMFRPDTPEHELRRIVRASGARLVGGPTAADAWLLDGGDTAASLARLRAEPAVVLAEPLASRERP